MEFVARLRQCCRIGLAQRLRDFHRIVVAGQRPEIVPVRMHRFGRVAFVADRCRHQSLERRIELAVFARAQAIHVGDRGLHMRPLLFQFREIAAIAIQLRDRVDQLAMTVVLGYGVRAAMIHAAGHLAVRELMRRVPVDVAARRIDIAEPQQAIGDHRAVAYPRARIRARAGSQCGAIARDQDMRLRRAQRVGDALTLRRQFQGHAVEFFAPRCGDSGSSLSLNQAEGSSASEIGAANAPLIGAISSMSFSPCGGKVNLYKSAPDA